MSYIDELMLSFYNNLLQIRYPEITKAEPRDVASVIFTGTNRIHLLSWLITEKSSQAANDLGKFQNTALEDELFKYYSQLGICTNKDVLLGNCPLEEQIPTLKLLLEFIENIYINSDNVENISDEFIEKISKLYFDESTEGLSILNNVFPKSSYENAKKYFENLTNVNDTTANVISLNIGELDILNELNQNTEDEDTFTSHIEKFVSVFNSVVHWPVPKKNVGRSYMDTDIKNLHANFTALKEIAHLTNAISTLVIPDDISQISTPLSTVMENIATCTEKDIFSIE